MQRLVAFELQLGPFTVAQLRVLAEVVELTGAVPAVEPKMYVTDTLGNPYVEEEWLPATYRPIGDSRRRANHVKREERITVVIGNPPYKEKAMGRGTPNSRTCAFPIIARRTPPGQVRGAGRSEP